MTRRAKRASGAVRERLVSRSWPQLAGSACSAWWLREIIDAVREDSYPAQLCLGPVAMVDAVVVPLVAFDDEVVGARMRVGLEPALDRLSLRERLDGQGNGAVTPVVDATFLGVWARTSLSALARLGGYGEVALLVPDGASPTMIELAECDWRGIGVATVGSGGEVDWLVSAARPVHRNRWTNMRAEQLLDLAFAMPGTYASPSRFGAVGQEMSV